MLSSITKNPSLYNISKSLEKDKFFRTNWLDWVIQCNKRAQEYTVQEIEVPN